MRPSLNELDGKAFDIVVVGAGINGAAAAKEAAARGYSVLLLEKDDYAAGSSSRSSRLLHCGLRYLAPGGPATEFLWHPGRFLGAVRTVYRSMGVRSELVGSIPERLTPFRMHFPLFTDSDQAPWQLDAAFLLLGTLGLVNGNRVPLDYQRSKAPHATPEIPFTQYLRDPDKLRSIASYTEYQFEWPERLVADIVFEGVEMGVVARNYTAVTQLCCADGQWQVTVQDKAEGETAVLSARSILNMAGAWADQVADTSDLLTKRYITGTKGSHLVFRLPEKLNGHGLAGMARNGRPFYCMPWRDLHFFGPTETLYEGDLDDVAVTPDEVEYIMSEAQYLFPGLGLSDRGILSGWAGIRPLTWNPALPQGERSRQIHEFSAKGSPPGFALTNGSLGAHRASAQDLLDRLASSLPKATPGPAAQRDRLTGVRSRAAKAPGIDMAEEHVVHLDDLISRRLGRTWDADLGLDDVQDIARAAAEQLNWSPDRAAEEVDRYRRLVGKYFALPADRKDNFQ